MIRSIAALDDCLGLATDNGIPWDIPADVEHFRTSVASSDVLMGYATYVEFERPLPGGTNFVLARPGSALRDDFVAVDDLPQFFAVARTGDIWVIGGAQLYALTLPFVEELTPDPGRGRFRLHQVLPAVRVVVRHGYRRRLPGGRRHSCLPLPDLAPGGRPCGVPAGSLTGLGRVNGRAGEHLRHWRRGPDPSGTSRRHAGTPIGRSRAPRHGGRERSGRRPNRG